jgi:hypothetical protein
MIIDVNFSGRKIEDTFTKNSAIDESHPQLTLLIELICFGIYSKKKNKYIIEIYDFTCHLLKCEIHFSGSMKVCKLFFVSGIFSPCIEI